MICVEKSDRRDISDTDSYIASIVASCSIVYCKHLSLLPSFQKAIFIVLNQLQTAVIVMYTVTYTLLTENIA